MCTVTVVLRMTPRIYVREGSAGKRQKRYPNYTRKCTACKMLGADYDFKFFHVLLICRGVQDDKSAKSSPLSHLGVREAFPWWRSFPMRSGYI